MQYLTGVDAFVNKYTELCCYLLYYTENYASAMRYFHRIISVRPEVNEFWKLHIAHCKQELGDFKEASELLEEVLVVIAFI